ncbi:unnamed protein product [Brugia timori]|uniref:Uncharacterized protein n=1 Tax=Brugia timori TaxID=42155 RepID=A0A0R3QEH1_9BILA|nr:unnamed protein product [Brugia timori]
MVPIFVPVKAFDKKFPIFITVTKLINMYFEGFPFWIQILFMITCTVCQLISKCSLNLIEIIPKWKYALLKIQQHYSLLFKFD